MEDITISRSTTVDGDIMPTFHCPENDDFYGARIYERLEAQPPEIRLLRALPPDDADPDGPLRFSLCQRIPLSECRETDTSPRKYAFVAMSYRAGNPKDTLPVLVDGRRFNVFRPLGLALRSLLWSLGRRNGNPELEETLLFWADQVCINQSDAEEKMFQVRLMRTIYESCAWTYSWLGASPQLTTGLRGLQQIDFIQQLIEDHYGKKNEPWQNSRNANLEWTSASLGRLEEVGFDWAAVGELLRCPYWTRGWVCQEVTVAPDVTFNTDEAETDRAGVRRAIRLLETIRVFLRWNCDVENGMYVPKKAGASVTTGELNELMPKVQHLTWLTEMDITTFLFILEDSEDWKESQGYTLDRLMLIARGSYVTDPLDKVYAYLGLAIPGYDIDPDYGPHQTVLKLYTRATCAYIERHRGLDILSFAEERSADLGPLLPSWVCDWTYRGRTESYWGRVRGDERVMPSASGAVGYRPTFLSHEGLPDRILVVPAIAIDSVSDAKHSVGGPVSSYASWHECLQSWLKVARLRIDIWRSDENDIEYPHEEGNTRGTAFWSTLFRGLQTAESIRGVEGMAGEARKNSSAMGVGMPPENPQSLGEAKTTTTTTGLEIADTHWVLAHAVDKSYIARAGWRFFQSSEREYFCFTKAEVRDGDVIMVLIGADVPFLMRPYEDGYRLLGEVYVHGIMKGEAMQGIDLGEEEEDGEEEDGDEEDEETGGNEGETEAESEKGDGDGDGREASELGKEKQDIVGQQEEADVHDGANSGYGFVVEDIKIY